MKYVSTKYQAESVTFSRAVFEGLSPDGGLYVPQSFPSLQSNVLDTLPDMSIADIAAEILTLFIEELPKQQLRTIAKKVLRFPFPVCHVGPFQVFELFHGPTLAFKDVAGHVLPAIIEALLQSSQRKLTILTATSGDTGAAVASGFADRKGIRAVILFPEGKVSEMQEAQMTHPAPNIAPISVRGTFDDCQAIVKKALNDKSLAQMNLTSANSINIGRLLPQMIYYGYLWAQHHDQKLHIVVPSGNMGNITAGLYARKIGIPIQSFGIACNTNDPVVSFIKTGKYKAQKSVPTLSTAMDIGAPSNFERMRSLFDTDPEMRKCIQSAERITDGETKEIIKKVWERYTYLLDPHSAVCWAAAEKCKVKSDRQIVVMATASPVKFAGEIEKATGIAIDSPKIRYKYPKKVLSSDPTYESVRRIITNAF